MPAQHYHLPALFTVIALSRLIRPTSTGDRYVARVFPYGDDPAIQAVQAKGVCADVFSGRQLGRTGLPQKTAKNWRQH